LTGHTMSVNSVTSLGADRLASGSNDTTINIWRPPFTSPPPAEEHLARRGRYSTRKHSTRKHSTRKHSARKRSTRKRSL
jgi:WD40 repeat protein